MALPSVSCLWHITPIYMSEWSNNRQWEILQIIPMCSKNVLNLQTYLLKHNIYFWFVFLQQKLNVHLILEEEQKLGESQIF